jgi:fucose permease
LAVALLTLSAVAFGFTYSDHAPLIPLVSAEFRLDDLGAGLLSTALFTSYLFTTLVTTGLAERLGPKRIVGAGSRSRPSALSRSPSRRTTPRRSPQRRSRASVQHSHSSPRLGTSRACTATVAITSRLGSTAAGSRSEARSHSLPCRHSPRHWGAGAAPFWAEALFVGAAATLWWRAPSVPRVVRPGTIRDALRCPNCWWTSLQHAAGFGMAIASGTWITVYLLREFHLPLELSGLLGSLLLVLAVLARPVGGLLLARERMPTRRVMRVGDLAIVAGVALLAIPDRPLAVALGGAVLVGIGVGLPYSAVFNTAAASLPTAPGAAQGLAAIGGTVGVMIGAPAMGYAVQTYGFWAAWFFVGLVSAIALVGTAFMRGEEELR